MRLSHVNNGAAIPDLQVFASLKCGEKGTEYPTIVRQRHANMNIQVYDIVIGMLKRRTYARITQVMSYYRIFYYRFYKRQKYGSKLYSASPETLAKLLYCVYQ